MNPILELKGQLRSRKNPPRPAGFRFPQGRTLSCAHIRALSENLRGVHSFWLNDTTIGGALVSVHYSQIVAKSNRIVRLLSWRGIKPSDSVRGAKFVKTQDGGIAHVFTHYVPLEALTKTIDELDAVAAYIKANFGEVVDADTAERLRKLDIASRNGLSCAKVMEILHDALYVSNLTVDKGELAAKDEAIVTIFKTGIETKELLSRYGIAIYDDRILDGTTLRLHRGELQTLMDKAPYLVSMQLADLREIPPETDSGEECGIGEAPIPRPTNEPTIGVIDTQFDTSVYFDEWVDYRNMLSKDIEIRAEDRWHGTAVDSIIVDGPRGNPRLDDRCGRFRVRHFGVATAAGFSSFEVLKMIRQIVAANRDIHVWNLSLGSSLEISPNFISPEGAVLDALQREYDIVFVVAGTNLPANCNRTDMRIGAPADSLNSVVVNAVGFDGLPASYSRVGPVLSFFNKPDVCYYGGDGLERESRIVVCRGLCASSVCGTSYAAPWIARKLAYMIEVLGLSREISKALLIDAAAEWKHPSDQNRMGFGIVPISIDDVVKAKNNEIRFFMTAVADEYETYTFQLPVPLVAGAYPYQSRVTLTYFPYCDQRQGVDYTGTEMDVHFGRVQVDEAGKNSIKSINKNRQGDPGIQVIYEAEARQMYRKWDNVKRVAEKVSKQSRPRKIVGPSRLWGLSVKTKERKTDGSRDKIPFGVVVTLREMNGVNRVEDFVRMCETFGWVVNRVDVKSRIDVYTKAEEEIVLE